MSDSRRWLRGAALVLTLAATAAQSAAQHPLMALPLDDPAYQQLAALVRVGCGEAQVSAFRPFTIEQIRGALVSARTSSRCVGSVLDALERRFLTVEGTNESGASAIMAESASDTATGFGFGAAL
ncbi:MAG TPA: hypothetical protein VFT57_00765, partial [Gemmatimonadaceae bacterium]|nr:hypothetical protein [Gemmatimonadaceae bacterium]